MLSLEPFLFSQQDGGTLKESRAAVVRSAQRGDDVIPPSPFTFFVVTGYEEEMLPCALPGCGSFP